MADILETGLTAGGGSILGAVAVYLGLERRVKKLEDSKFITHESCVACNNNAKEWREEVRNKLDMLLDIHLKDRRGDER